MCGITGFIDFKKSINRRVLLSMIDSLTHRGPDTLGDYYKSCKNYSIGLGHRRLSILDLSKNGNQPMSYKSLKIIYNGEVYNFKEIKKEL